MRRHEWKTTQECDARVARIGHADPFFKIEVPLPRLWFFTGRNLHRCVRVVHPRGARQLACDVDAARALCAAISFL